jgi:hypothetical protein
MAEKSAERQVAGFIAKYSPEVARVARQARHKIRRLLPGAVELVYDNYNALALAFGPTERPSDLILSVALYPRWVSLFFTRGAELADPHRLLRGSGSKIRHVVVHRAVVLDSAPVKALIKEALASHPKRLAPGRGWTIIQSVSAKHRPRRPTTGPPNERVKRTERNRGMRPK